MLYGIYGDFVFCYTLDYKEINDYMFSSFSCCGTSAPENTPDYSYNSVGAFRTESVMLYSMDDS